eukprot:CAMPEP_0172326248 /NCGR_PEP_ID=MMETSP1058-20130122/56003_1 /TAXON_ID=83371 /ORGANISM="Detonula confervacea, Strain CCMP 353" /LENGTH=473 /DNA_ID=CAMNT_0013042991 /DNA_START=41 /DNA_END=1462 /DNA_ORIENTATION=-
MMRNVGTAALSFVHVPQCYSISTSASKMKWRSNNTSRCLSSQNDIDSHPIKNVAIVGGGLAGLSAAYHLLNISGNKIDNVPRGIQITIFDKANVGEGGASSVAGGLLHPFSPRGKLIHFGLSALEHSNHLIQMSTKHQPHCIIRPRLNRIALNAKNVVQLQHTAENYPNLATWMSKEEMQDKFGIESLGGIELGNGCKVVHVPSYLRGLWEECEMKARDINGSIKWELVQMPSHGDKMKHDTQKDTREPSVNMWSDIDSMNQHLAQYDAVILSAGAGILQDQLISGEDELPVNQVRGQSIEMTLPAPEDSGNDVSSDEAFLCGKYVTPLPTNPSADDSSSQRFVIGATHEFKSEPLNPDEVMEELKSRTYSLAKNLWDHGTVDRLTTGVRLQSNRGSLGRMPIVGRYNNTSKDSISHHNSWIFSGLSSRGLIHHGLFGRWLANAVLHDNEDNLRDEFPEFDWWKKKTKREAER